MTKLTLKHFLASEGKALGPLLAKLNQLNQWNIWLKESLGEDILAKHCYVVKLDKTALIVITDSAHWNTRLRFRIPELLPKLRQYPGLENVGGICCKTQPNHQATPKTKKRPLSKLSAKTAAILHDSAQRITDEKLRKVLEKIALHTQ